MTHDIVIRCKHTWKAKQAQLYTEYQRGVAEMLILTPSPLTPLDWRMSSKEMSVAPVSAHRCWSLKSLDVSSGYKWSLTMLAVQNLNWSWRGLYETLASSGHSSSSKASCKSASSQGKRLIKSASIRFTHICSPRAHKLKWYVAQKNDGWNWKFSEIRQQLYYSIGQPWPVSQLRSFS